MSSLRALATKLLTVTGLIAAFCPCPELRAQDNATLLDALVRRGLLTDQDAQEIRADLARDQATPKPARKLDVSTGVSRLRIGGDVRTRYQYDDFVANGDTQHANDRARFRYRVRLGAVAELGPHWSTGVRLETAGGATTANADFGDNFAKEPGDTAYVGQAFIRYAGDDVLGADTLRVDFGKFAHRFSTPGVNGFWIDSDINFEGLAQELVYRDALGPDGDLAFRAGQFVLNGNSGSTTDAAWLPSLLHVAQAQASRGGLSMAPAVVAYGAPSSHDARNTTPAQLQNDTTNYTDLVVVLLPVEYRFDLGSAPAALYATYGENLRGRDRARRLAASDTIASDPRLFNLGLRYGEGRRAGDHVLVAEYRHVGNGAYTSLLLDADFNGGLLNASGWLFSGTYQWTADVASSLAYITTFNLEPTQPTNQNANGIGFGGTEIIRMDLSVRF